MPASDTTDRFDLGISRDGGLTHVLDKGLGPRAWEDVLETAGDYIDIVKLGWGTAWVTANLERKLEVLAGKRVVIGGTFFEVVYARDKLEEYKRLATQCMEIVRTKDTGTLQYDTYFNEDQSECIVLERFKDSEALIEHAANIGALGEAILSIVDVVHGELLGEPNAEIRANLADMDVPQLFTPYQSM